MLSCVLLGVMLSCVLLGMMFSCVLLGMMLSCVTVCYWHDAFLCAIGMMLSCVLLGMMLSCVLSALDKLLGQLGIYTTWKSSIAYLQRHCVFSYFFKACFFL